MKWENSRNEERISQEFEVEMRELSDMELEDVQGGLLGLPISLPLVDSLLPDNLLGGVLGGGLLGGGGQ